MMEEKQCSMCSDVSKKRCEHCGSITYCSSECQSADWAVHHILCDRLRQHAIPPQPDPSTRLGIFFRVDSSTPEFVWVNIYKSVQGTEHITSLKPYLGSSNDHIVVRIRHNVIRSRRRLADQVQLFMRDDAEDLPLNRSVAMLTGGLAWQSWRGGMLAMKVRPWATYSEGKFSHMDPVDFRDVVDLFRSYKSGVDMNDASANPRHTGPASILENRLILDAAARLQHQFGTSTPPPPPAAVELPDRQSMIIRYDPPHDRANTGQGGDTIEAVVVPSTDPVWSNPVTSIPSRLGMSVKTPMKMKTRVAREHLEDLDPAE